MTNGEGASFKRNGSGGAEDPVRPRRSSPWRAILIISFLVVAFAGLFFFGYRKYQNRQRVVEAAADHAEGAIPVVSVERVRRAATSTELTLPGNTMPMTEASIYARASGYVRRRLVDIGDRVLQGQLLAEIEAPELDQQVQQARATLAQAEKQLDQAKADLAEARAKMELARITWDRYKVLVDHGAVSRQDGDQQQTTLRSTSAVVTSVEARIGSAEQSVRGSSASLERLVTLQEFERVRAPFNGVVTARNFDVGALVSSSGGSMGQSPGGGPGTLPGASAGSQGGELFRIAQVGVLRVLVNVPESSAPAIRPGQSAVVLAQAFPRREFLGRIARTANAVDVASRTMLTEIQLPNSDLVLLPGMFVSVRLVNARAEPPLLIPGDSVITTAQGLRVAVLEDLQPQEAGRAATSPARAYSPQAKRVQLRQIQIGRDYGQQLEVVNGLQGWEYLVVNPGDEVIDGAIVMPTARRNVTGGGGQSRGSESK